MLEDLIGSAPRAISLFIGHRSASRSRTWSINKPHQAALDVICREFRNLAKSSGDGCSTLAASIDNQRSAIGSMRIPIPTYRFGYHYREIVRQRSRQHGASCDLNAIGGFEVLLELLDQVAVEGLAERLTKSTLATRRGVDLDDSVHQVR